MNVFDRIGLAFKALTAPRAALAMPWYTQGQPIYPDYTYENYVRQGYRKNELIFACVDTRQTTASSVTYRAYSKTSGDEIENHPARALLQRPNPHMTEFDLLSLTIAFLDLAGVAYWEKVHDGRGNLMQLWPLRPDLVVPVADREVFIREYIYNVPGVAEIRIPPEKLLVFKQYDPLDLYKTTPRVRLAARVGDVDNSTTDFLKLFFERGTMPPFLLKSKNKLTPQQVAEVKRQWMERYSGFNKWFEPAVLDVDADYQRLDMNFRDMAFEALDSRNEARICMIMRVPPILIGAKVGLDQATYSNYEEARRSMWQDTMAPMYKSLGNSFTNGLAPDFGEADLEIKADLSEVVALKENEESKATIWNERLTSGGCTLNEYRKAQKMEDLGPDGEVLYVPAGAILMTQKALMETAKMSEEANKPVQPPAVLPDTQQAAERLALPEGDVPPAEDETQEKPEAKEITVLVRPETRAEPPAGQALPYHEAIDIPPFSLAEQNQLFELYQQLTGVKR